MAGEAAVDAGEFDAGRWSRKSSSLKGGSTSSVTTHRLQCLIIPAADQAYYYF